MPNLVGIGNSQVPTNAMLGGLAYQDSVGEIDIDKIKAKINDTVADIFVYDTRKDSDGGAWRHRTQNKSWYNEGASSTRGARKEFPAVAVIVAKAAGAYGSSIMIYDGDDPNLPMWMVFQNREASGGSDQTTTSSYYAAGPYYTRKVAMLNGIMVDCQYRSSGHAANTVKGVTRFNFIDDSSTMMTDQGDFKRNGNLGDERNTEKSYTKISTTDIVQTQCNDVAMTVLPNAPIDASTGLPIPTIAVATDGGTNIINDDGTVTQGYQTIATENVDLHPDGFMTDGISGATNDSFSFYKIGTIARLASYGHRASVHNITTFLNEGTGECLFEGSGNKIAIAQSLGLLRIEETYPESFTPGNDALSFGLHNRTTSSYNTGWMQAAIKGAFLSSIDDTNVTGSELLANPGPSFSNTTNWYLDAANKDTGTIATLTVSSGRLVFTHSDTNAYWDGFGTSFSCTVGEVYVVKADIHSATNMNVLRISNTASQHDEDIPVAGSNVAGVHAHTFTATSTTMYLHWNAYTNTSAMQLNSVSVRLGVEDRSVNDNGFQVFGTITKTPVATGAELVAYSGFSASNYLQQPYNSDLNFGTGDLSIIFWYKMTSSATVQCLLHRGDGGSGTWGSGNIIQIEMDTTNMELQLSASGFTSFDEVQVPVAKSVTGQWQHFVGVRETGRAYIYIDGVKYGDVASSRDLSNTAAKTWIGQRPNVSRPATNTSMALLRMSTSVPTEEQVIKMYNDEKHLFDENAKCTLYGTSDAVTAVAYDDTTDVLHVGTSSGRSEFRGLNRINNTTTAVTTAISASNELVAEQ